MTDDEWVCAMKEHFAKAPPPDVEADVTFLRSDEGGLSGPVRSGCGPQVVYDGHAWGSRFRFETDDWVPLGACLRTRIWFTDRAAHVGRFWPGKEFEIWDGRHLVGHGRVRLVVALMGAE